MNNLPLETLVNLALTRLLSLSDEELQNRLERCKHSNLARVFADCSKFGDRKDLSTLRELTNLVDKSG